MIDAVLGKNLDKAMGAHQWKHILTVRNNQPESTPSAADESINTSFLQYDI